MIAIKLNDPNIEGYAKVHHRFEKAFAALRELAENLPENGTYKIDGDDIYAMVQSYQPKAMTADTKFETHKDYIDIQYLAENGEMMLYEREEELIPVSEYKPDVQFFAQNKGYDTLYVNAGELLVFFPGEAHAPGLAQSEAQQPVRKIVMKVRV